MRITGTHFNDYWLCHRKLWLFANGLTMEQDSNLVCEDKCFINLELPTAHIKISRGGYRGHKS